MTVQVVYIAGAGRSGSTLLEMILGNLPGFFSVGEVRYFWEYMEVGTLRCGCHQSLVSCPFWSRVREDLERALAPEDFGRAARLASRLDRTRNLPWLTTGLAGRVRAYRELVGYTSQLYQAISRQAGGAVVIDSSKVPSHLRLLTDVPALRLRVLHLVRDGRAVAHAWSRRRKRELACDEGEALMPRRPAGLAAVIWAVENRFAEALGGRAGHYTLLRYEDLVEQTVASLHEALRELGFGDPDLAGIDPQRLRLSPTHSVGGNPVRFLSGGPVAIRPSRQWRDELTPSRRRYLEALVGRTLRRYGYGGG